jgi:hypothetical protein
MAGVEEAELVEAVETAEEAVEVEMAEEAAAGEEESTLKNILRKFSIKM